MKLIFEPPEMKLISVSTDDENDTCCFGNKVSEGNERSHTDDDIGKEDGSGGG